MFLRRKKNRIKRKDTNFKDKMTLKMSKSLKIGFIIFKLF